MRTAKYRHVIVALLLMMFIGQVIASTTVSCQSSSASMPVHGQMMDSGVKDHSQHMGSDVVSSDGMAAADCCPDCDCSLGGCSSVVLSVHQTTFYSSLKALTAHYDESVSSQLAVSLLRPPIVR